MKKNFEVAAAEMLNCAKQCASADPCAPETLHQDLRQKMMHSTNNLRNRVATKNLRRFGGRAADTGSMIL